MKTYSRLIALLLPAMLFVLTERVIAQSASQIRVETKADSTGTVVPAQTLASGDSLVVYAITRTSTGGFVANDTATWTLESTTGGVIPADLVPRPDKKSAVLKARLAGSAVIRATEGILTSVPSGTITVAAGPAKKLAVVQQPTLTTAGAPIAAITVQIRDSLGNNVKTAGVSILASMNSGTGVLGGTLSRQTDTNGLATFTGLNINLAGTKTLKMTSVGLDSAVTDTFSITPAAAKKLVFVQPPTNDTAGVIITPPITVQVQDTFGNNVSTIASITMSLATGGGVLSGTAVKPTNASGLATFNDLSINLVGSKTLKARSAGLDSVVSPSFTITPGSATRLVVHTEPSPTATAGVAFAQQPVIWVVDSQGNQVTSDNTTSVTATRAAGSGTLSGVTTLTASGGAVTFTNLRHTVAGTITIRFTSIPALTPDTSGNIVVSPAGSSKLVFVQQPTNAVAGASIVPAPTVQVQDSFGNNVPLATSIVLSLGSGNGVLSGTTTQMSSSSGLATFPGLSVNLTGSKQLKAKSGVLDSVLSASFTITSGAASRLSIQTQPSPTATAGVAFAQQPVIRILDSQGNLVATDNTTSVTATRTAGAGTLGGTVTLTAANGVVSFTNLKHTVSGTITIRFTSSPVLTPDTSTSIVVSAAAASKLVFVQQPTGTVSGASIAPAPTVQLQDTFGNSVPQSGTPVAMTLSTGTGTLTGTTPQSTNTSGLATFPDLSIDQVGNKILTASRTGLVSAASNSFAITVGPPATVVATAGTPQSALVNTTFATRFRALVRDAAGNVVSGATVTFAAPTTGASGKFTGGVRNASVVTDTAGVALAPVFTADTVAGTYNVTASVSGVPTPATYALTNTPGPARKIAATAGTPQSVQISTPFPVNFQATVRDTFGNPLAGIVVTFTAPPSGASGTFQGGVNTATTNASGVATAATFSANINAGSYSVTATAPGIATPATFSLTNLPGSPNSVTAMAGTPQAAQIGTAFATNLKALVRDGASNAVPNVLVMFRKPAATGPSGTFAGGIDTVRTDASGIATAPVFTANTFAGSYADSAFVAGVSSPALFLLTNTSGSPGSIVSTAGTPQSTVVNTAFATGMEVSVKDGSGNPVSGVTVTFTAPSSGVSGKFGTSRTATAVTNTSGLATAPVFTADTVAGSYQVTASAPGVSTPAIFSMTNSPAPASRIVATAGTPQSAQVGTVFATNFKVRVSDAYNNPINGNVVTFTPPASGPSGAFSGNVNTATTDSTGVATAVPFAANFISGTYNLPAAATGVPTPAQFALTNTSGGAASITATGGTPQTTQVNTAFASLAATVRDGAGNPVPGVSVTFNAPVTGASGRFSSGLTTFTVSTNASGVALAPITANAIAGSFSVNASVSGVGAPAVFSLTNTAGSAATLSPFAGTPQSATVNRPYATNFQVLVKDSSNNVAPGVLVRFTKPTGSGPNGTFAGNVDTVRTVSNGVATAVQFTANEKAGSFVVNATVVGITDPVPFSLTNLAGSAANIAATQGTPQSTQVNTAFGINLAVAVKDSFNNPTPGLTVTFTVPTTGASGTFAGGVNIATTNAAGVATAPVLTANNRAGQFTVNASVPGVSTPAPFLLTNNPSQASSIIATAGTPQSAQVNTPYATNFRVLVQDGSGNPVRNVSVTFTAPPVSGPSGTFANGNPVLTDSNGIAVASQFQANSSAGAFVVTAGIGVGTPAQFSLTNTPGAAASITSSGGTPQSTTVGTQFPLPLQALVRDTWGNAVPGVEVTFTSPSTGATCNFAGASIGTATTNANGVASIVAIANTASGQYSVTATGVGISTPTTFSLSNTAAAAATITSTAGTPQSAQVGTVFGVNLEATVRDAFSNLVPNALVRFSAPAQTGPSGTFQNGIDTVRTGQDGVATARPFTANLLAGGPYVVSATTGGVATGANFSLTNLTGPPGSITIQAGTPQSAVVTTAFAIRFKVQVKDAANNPIPNVPVTFTPPIGGATGKFEGTSGGSVEITTDAGGIAEAPRFLADTVAGSYPVSAFAQNVSTPVSFELTNLPGTPTRLRPIAGSGQSAQISTAFATNFEAAVQDTFYNYVPNVLVRWIAPTTDPTGTFPGPSNIATSQTNASGIATAPTFVASFVAGNYAVAAVTPGVRDTIQYFLRNTPGPAQQIGASGGSGQTTTVGTTFAGRLRAIVRDGASNGVPNVLVRFSRPLTGASGTFQNGIDTARTDNSGIATAVPLTANTTVGSYTVSASVSGVSQPAEFMLTNRATPPAAIFATDGTPQSAQVNTNFATRFSATVRDSFSNPVSGWTVVFTAPGTGASGTFEGATNQWTTNDSGVATASIFRANGFAGEYQVRASATSLTQSVVYNLTNTPGPVGTLTLAGGSPQSAVVNNLFSQPLRVRVSDAVGNPVSGVSVTFTAPASGPGGTFPGGAVSRVIQSDTGGIAQADSFKANGLAGTYNVNATVAGISGPVMFAMTNTVGALSGFSVEAESGGPIPTQLAMNFFNVKFTARDAYNNPVAGFTGTVRVSSSGSLYGDTVTMPFTSGALVYRALLKKAGTNITITARQTTDASKTGTSNAFQVNNPVPRVASVTPDSAQLGQTLSMTVRGSNFIDSVVTSLYIRRQGTTIVPSSSLTVVDTTQLRATVTIPSDTSYQGNWSLTVGNADAGESLPVLFKLTFSVPPAPILAGPANQSRNVSVTPTLAWGSSPLATSYNLQVATDSLFAGRVFDGLVSGTSRSLDTLQYFTTYFWRVRAMNSKGFGPFSAIKSFTTVLFYPASYDLSATVAFPDRASPGDFLSAEYRMVGVPGNGAGAGLRIADLLAGAQNVDWVVYRDNGAAQNYTEPYNGTSVFQLTPGSAFWVLKKGVWTISRNTIPTATLDQGTLSVSIALHDGWNMITNPFNVPIPWTEVRKINGTLEPIFGFQGAYDTSATLVPYGGYYFLNSRSLSSLRIPYGSFATSSPSASALAKSPEQGGWKVGVEFSSGHVVDRLLSFGVVPGTDNGYDASEYHKPRSFGDAPIVFFDRPEWDNTFSNFAADYRPSVERVQTWTFDAKAPLRGEGVLRFNGVTAIPSPLKIYLIDQQRARFVDLQSSPVYTFSLPTGSARFQVAVGEEEAIREILSTLLPKEFSLGNNFPNPFNPATTIPVAVPHTADISLKVYNILGEEVRTVFSGQVDAGRYFYTWDGKNDAGNTVATGIYLVRFRAADGPTFTSKMILMK